MVILLIRLAITTWSFSDRPTVSMPTQHTEAAAAAVYLMQPADDILRRPQWHLWRQLQRDFFADEPQRLTGKPSRLLYDARRQTFQRFDSANVLKHLHHTANILLLFLRERKHSDAGIICKPFGLISINFDAIFASAVILRYRHLLLLYYILTEYRIIGQQCKVTKRCLEI